MLFDDYYKLVGSIDTTLTNRAVAWYLRATRLQSLLRKTYERVI
jgi:hypothetical protein